MPTRFSSFNFEYRLSKRMEFLSSIHQALPPQPELAEPSKKVFLGLDSPSPPSTSPWGNEAEGDDLGNAEGDIQQTAVHRIECEAGDLWLRGSTLLCACPDCHAPMTIRVWLGLADCWRCSASIALSDEQRAAATALQEINARASRNSPAPPAEFASRWRPPPSDAAAGSGGGPRLRGRPREHSME